MRYVLAAILPISATLLGSAAVAATSMDFPGKASALKSPDGKWTVINRDVDNEEEPHILVLRANGMERPLYKYGRHVLVAWSPDSRRIAITDYAGSNVAECVVMDAATLKSTDVMADAIRTSKKIARIMGNFHSYFECLRWTSDRELRVKVSGHGDNDPAGVTFKSTYRLP